MLRVIAKTLGIATVLFAVSGTGSSAATAQVSQTPTDGTLKDRIEYRLETNTAIKKYDVDVKVDNGIVTLTGEVANELQKVEAGKLAKIDGISKVQNDIAVNKDVDRTLAERTKSGLSKTGEAITDAWITTKVKWFFVGEDALKDSNINVDTANKVVTLKGTVKSAAGKARAVALARGTEGVQRVVDQLTIGS